MVKFLTVNEVKKIYESDGDCQIIDVREIPEYLSVRIPESKLVPLSEFEQKINSIDCDKSAYFLCGVGKRALKAAEYLESIGYKDLYVIEGGIKAWIEAGFLIESGNPKE